MSKILSALICILMVITLFAGCSGNSTTAAPSIMVPIPIDSIEEFHNFVLVSRAFANDGITPHGMPRRYTSCLYNAIHDRIFGDTERYYMPSWLPEGFELNVVRFNSGFVGFRFNVDGFDYSQGFIHEYLLNDQVSFTWFTQFPPPYAEIFFNNQIESLGLEPAVGVAGLYYYDFPAICNPSVNIVRSYFWMQNSYVFMIDIPLWVIEEHGHPNDGFGIPGRAPVGKSIADLVMNSALAVELVDGESYVPPTDIEIVGSTADIGVGENLILTANVSPENATIDAVIWSSSDNSVATLTQNGVVTRVAEGAAIITARTLDGNLTATFRLGGAGYTAAPEEITELCNTE